MLNWLIFSSFVFSMVMTCLGLMLDMSFQLKYKPAIEKYQQNQQRNLADYLKAEASYREHEIFGKKQAHRDDFLTRLTELSQGDLQKPLLPAATKKDFLSLGKKWLDQKHRVPKLESVESLFSEIEKYDQHLFSRAYANGLRH